MTDVEKTYNIFSLAKRIQHFLFILAFTASFLSGMALAAPQGLMSGLALLIFRQFDVLFWWHAFFGMTVLIVIVGHLLYLIIRGYVESIPFKEFPLRLRLADLGRLPAEMKGLLKDTSPDGRRYSNSRKLAYWIFLFGAWVVVLSGISVYYWDWIDLPPVSANLGFLMSLHGGVSLFIILLVLWHVYDVLAGGSRWSMVGLFFTGRLTEGDLKGFFPDEYEKIRAREKKLREEWLKKDREGAEEKERDRERMVIEEILQEGNLLAREERFLEAAEKYRQALENYPGYSQAQYNLALVLEKAGRAEEALREYRRFLEIDPFHPLADRIRQAIFRLEDR